MSHLIKYTALVKKVILSSLLLLYFFQANGQATKKERLSTIILGTHIGSSNGHAENGLGSSISVGYMRHFGKTNNLVIGANFISGAYRALAIPTDISSQTFKSSSLGIELSYNVHFLRLGTGIECNYTRGNISDIGDFSRLSYGGRTYLGFVKSTKKENIQFEFRPADLLFGTGSFLQYHASFLMHFNLR